MKPIDSLVAKHSRSLLLEDISQKKGKVNDTLSGSTGLTAYHTYVNTWPLEHKQTVNLEKLLGIWESCPTSQSEYFGGFICFGK